MKINRLDIAQTDLGIEASSPLEAATSEASDASVETRADSAEPLVESPIPGKPKRRWLRRIAAWTAAGLSLLLLVGVGYGVWAAHRAFPTYDGSVRLTGLTADVTVLRDANAIPQIYADNTDDLFAAEGYVTAQERFWQMDFDRHLSAGRLAEMFGADSLSTDLYLRTMDWHGIAAQEWKIISPASRRYLTAYARGVNAFLEGRAPGKVSLEYTVLGLTHSAYRIVPWTPVDSLAWLKALAWDLRGNMSDEIGRSVLLANGFTRKQVESLYPNYPYDAHAAIVGAGGSVSPAADRTPHGGALPAAALPALEAVQTAMRSLPSTVGTRLPGAGSNSWVISGRLTDTGAPILANDPHLAATMPGVWFQVGLHCSCGFNVEGFSFPGVPGVAIGHNDKVAWGFTNMDPDVTDLYLEKVKGDRYEVDGRWRPLKIRTTTIEVAGGKPVELTIRETDHGPILSDHSTNLQQIVASPGVDPHGAAAPRAAGGPSEPGVAYAVALKWTALTPGRTIDAMFDLDQATDWTSFRAAAANFEVPAQNLVYADTAGNIGYQAPGRIPVRGMGDGRWPAPGWDSRYDWHGFIPYAELPTVFNPPGGFIATANQAVADPATFAPLLTADWSYGYRSERIGDMIRAATAGGAKLSVADVSHMQTDTRNGFAAQVVPTLLGEKVSGRTAKAIALLKDWDYSEPVDSAPAAFFNTFWHQLANLTFDEIPSAIRPDGGDRWFVVFDELLADPDNRWWDTAATSRVEKRGDIVVQALDAATDQLVKAQGGDPAKWTWGSINQLTIRNPSLGDTGIPPIDWLFDYGPVGVPGGCDVVTANCSDLANGFGAVTSVPSMRMVVDLADLDRSRWVQITGESGHAFSDQYHDQINLWLNGDTLPMPWTDAAVRSGVAHTMVLTPRV